MSQTAPSLVATLIPVAQSLGEVPVVGPVVELTPDPPAELLRFESDNHDEPEPATVYPRPGIFRRVFKSITSAIEWCFGAASLFLGLAILSAVPILQFLALGYLLEASGRVTRSGRLRDGFIGVRFAARLGGAALGVAFWWLPLWFLSSLASSASIIDPGGRNAQLGAIGVVVASVLVLTHVTLALLAGGKLRYFFWPFNFIWLIRPLLHGELYQNARDGLWAILTRLRLPYYFWLGFRGFVGGYLWLLLPLFLLGFGHRNPGLGLLGAVLLVPVVYYVPFLMARFARDRQMKAFLQPWAVRQDFQRAPLAFAFALTVTLTLAMPLYLLKIEAIPRDLVFLENLVFLGFIFPSKLLIGWAYSRAAKRDHPRNFFWRWFVRFLVFPVVLLYVLAVFTSQHLGWSGISSLYEQHAFLLPVPFTSLGD